MNYGIIYKITNKINGKIYIGQTTTSLKRRWNMHKSASRKNRSNSALHSSISKYGYINFIIEPICSCFSEEELNLKEIYFIDTLNSLAPNGYNLKSGGANGKHTIESKEKMSVIQKQLVAQPEYKAKITKYLLDYSASIGEAASKQQSSLSSMEYWSTPGNKLKKADTEIARWKELTDEQKTTRLSGFREYWTEDKLKEHSDKMKVLKSWEKSGCLLKAQAATSKAVRVIEISTQKEQVYSSRAKCTKALMITAKTLIEILNGSRSNEYKGYRFIPM